MFQVYVIYKLPELLKFYLKSETLESRWSLNLESTRASVNSTFHFSAGEPIM